MAYLLLYGELPTKDQLAEWEHNITYHTFMHESMKRSWRLQPRRASDGDADLRGRGDVDVLPEGARRRADNRLLADEAPDREDADAGRVGVPAHRAGSPYVYPDNDLGFTENFLSMMFRMAEPSYGARPGARAGARGAVHPPRRPRAELLGERHARDRVEQGRSLQRPRRSGSRSLRSAARRRERGSARDARRRSATWTACRRTSSG